MDKAAILNDYFLLPSPSLKNRDYMVNYITFEPWAKLPEVNIVYSVFLALSVDDPKKTHHGSWPVPAGWDA